MHKEELEEEQQEELEKKMLDKDSQEGLKKLVEEIKKDKLGSAQKEIDKAGEMTRAENERAKLDKAKAEKEAKESAK
jgi:nitric oxide synthase oxygenase domain/subunit